MLRIALTAFVCVTLLGCGSGRSSFEPVLCEVAHDLTVAAATTAQAAERDAAGDKVGAELLARDAASRAAKAHDQLHTIDSEQVHQDETWQALLKAYADVGQAANALLPGFEATYGMTDEMLALAHPYLATAAAGLPAECTTVNESPGVAPA